MGSLYPTQHPVSAVSSDEASQRLNGLLYAALDCIVSVDAEGRILEFNPAAERVFGYAAAQALGQPMAELLIPPEYRERHHHGMKRNLETGDARSLGRRMELEAMRADGSSFPCELTLTRHEAGGKVIFTSFLRDITDRRRFEERVRRLNESLEQQVAHRTAELTQAVARLQQARDQLERAQEIARVGDAVYFPFSGLRLWSKETFRLYGLEPAAEAPSLSRILASLYSRDLQANREAIMQSFCGPICPPEIEYRVVHADGAIRWLRVVSLAESGDQAEANRIVSTIQDVTKQKAAEEEMLRAMDRERELGQLKSDFLNMITHEYRTPLGVIHSAAEVLSRYHDRLQPEDRLARLDDIKQSARRLADLVEEVLFLGKSESGRMALNCRPIDYARVLREAADSIVAQYGFPRDIRYHFDSLPSECEADGQLFRHIANNGLSNALKYSTLDKPVFIAATAADGGVSITIRDEGIGIPAADQKKLFSMFQRASNVGTVSGTGLGLVIAKRCADYMGGRLSLSSQVGKGTELRLWLPIRPSQHGGPAPQT